MGELRKLHLGGSIGLGGMTAELTVSRDVSTQKAAFDAAVGRLRTAVPLDVDEGAGLVPWLLMYPVIIGVVGYGVYYFMKHRRAA